MSYVIWAVVLLFADAADPQALLFHTYEKEPFYDKSTGVIVTALECLAVVVRSSCNIEWMILSSGTTPTTLYKAFKIPGKILSSAVTKTKSGCASALTLRIHPNTPRNSLPLFQCRLTDKDTTQAVSKAMQPNQYVAIVPAVSKVTTFRGQNATFRCPIANDLPPTDVSAMPVHWWHLNSARMNLSRVESFGMTHSIYDVTEADGGWYQCHPIGYGNTVMVQKNSSWVRLVVEGPPGVPVQFRVANSNCSSGTINFEWNGPTGNVSAIQIGCDFGNFVFPPSILNPNRLLLNTTLFGDQQQQCGIRFINPAGVGEYSHSIPIPVCVLEEIPSSLPWWIVPVAVAAFAAVVVSFLFFWCKCRIYCCWRRACKRKGHEHRQSQHSGKDEKSNREILKEVRGGVREILDSIGLDNTSNAMSSALSTVMSREESPPAPAWRGDYFKGGVKKKEEEAMESEV